jgi:hypothetical protein
MDDYNIYVIASLNLLMCLYSSYQSLKKIIMHSFEICYHKLIFAKLRAILLLRVISYQEVMIILIFLLDEVKMDVILDVIY